jgi:hypothetical protein
MPSIEETMGEVFDKLQEPVETTEPVVSEVVEAVEPVEPEKYEPTAESDGRVRDPLTGKFLPKVEKAEKSAPEKAEPEKTEEIKPAPETAAPETTDQPPSDLGFQPPGGWSAAAKADFLKASPAIQAAVAQREKEVSEGFKQYEGIGKALHPVKHILTQNGVSAPEYVNRLVQADLLLQQKPQEAMAMIAKMYGIPLPQGQAVDNPQPVDPTLAPLHQQIQELQQFREQTLRQQQEAEQSKAQELQTTAASEVEKFKSDPKNEFFDIVREDMSAVYAHAAQMGLPTPTVQQAYEKAIWANEKTRPIMLAREAQALRDKAIKDASANASKAVRAVSGNVRGTQGVAPAIPLSMEEEMRQVYEAVNSGRAA